MKPSNGIPDATEFGLRRAHLIRAFEKGGRNNAQAIQEVAAMIGNNVNGRTRDEIATTIATYLRNAPKGV